MTVTSITLNNGQEIPQIGLGVYQIAGDAATEQAVSQALAMGYRHIDTAHAYQNERGVGTGVQKSGIPRQDVWLTSKLWPSDYGESTTPEAIDRMLTRLKTDYVDLLLLHQQFGDYVGAWTAMERAVREGKVRSIGLSNFDGDRLDKILSISTIKPAVMQVELHPYFAQTALKAKLVPFHTQFESWYPLGHGDAYLLEEPVFEQLAAKYEKSTAQIILRWHIQMHHIVFPKTTNPDHMRDNLNLFDFKLTDSEMAEIATLDSNKRYFNVSLKDQERQFASWVPAD